MRGSPRRPDRPTDRPLARLADVLRRETAGGVLLLVSTGLALAWANSPWREAYTALGATTVGPAALHLSLPLATWAADGLLAVFFFVAGLELGREVVAGELADPARAVLPVAAALGGMAVPALIYTAVNAGHPEGLAGAAVPTATDIAFALAVLAVVGRGAPPALRTFLLTLAVVDDLLAITIIAVVYTDRLAVGPLLAALVPLALFGAALRRRIRTGWVLLPLAAATWGLVHASGVHATVAGVLLGFAVPVRGGLAERLEHRWRPVSAGVAVPVFAFLAAGVTLGGVDPTSPITLGVVAGLVVGKAVGVSGAAWLVARWTRARLADALGWVDVVGLSLLAGIGFTVSLLIGGLAFGGGSAADDQVKVGIVVASGLAAILGGVVLRGAARRRARTGTPEA